MGQTYQHTPMICSGPIPADFTTLSSQKFQEGISKGKTNKREQTFLLESSFLVDQVLHSGRAIFNHRVNVFLGQVLDEILHNEPELRSKIRIYVMRSSGVNAFTTNDGIILINLGLLAQLENEAQLAFVLCHEIVHFTQGHAMNAYLGAETAQASRGIFKKPDLDNSLLKRTVYASNFEFEADSLGLIRFCSSGYSTKAISSVFDMMRYAHVPYDDLPFPIVRYNSGLYAIDQQYELNKVRTIEPATDDDPLSHHPATSTRKQRALLWLNQLSEQTMGVEFKVSENEFDIMRKTCRHELVKVLNDEGDPAGAIYHNYLLERENPLDPFLAFQEARSLYTLCKYKNAGSFGSIHPGWSQQQGEIQQTYHLFYRLQPDELNVLTIRELFRLYRAFGYKKAIWPMLVDALADLTKYHGRQGLIERALPQNLNDTSASANDRYGRIERKSMNDPRKWMVTYGLIDLFEDTVFVHLHDSIASVIKNVGPTGPSSQNKKSKKSGVKPKSFAIGAKAAVCISPTYMKFDMRKRQNNRFLSSEEARIDLERKLAECGKLTGLDLRILSPHNLTIYDATAYNDLVLLNNWATQRYRELEVGMIDLHHDELEPVTQRYGTDHFVWTGVVTYRESKPLRFFHLLYLLLPPTIPFAMYHLIRPTFDTHYFFISLNATSGEPEMVAYNNFQMRDAGDFVNANIYDSFYQLKRSPRKTKP